MGDSRSPTKDSYSILGITKTATIKDMCKAYKSLVTKWNPDKNPSNKTEADAKFKEIKEAYKVLNERKLEDLLANEDDPTTTAGAHSHHKSVDDIGFFSRRSSFLSRTSSRRSQTPTPTRSYLSRSQSKSSSTTPRMQSTPATPTSTTKFSTSPTSTTESSTKRASESRSKSTSRRSASEIPSVLSRNASRRSTTPIIFSQSTARRKPPPVEKTLECTLEDLCFGCVKRINITKDVIMDPGIIVKEHEVLKINIQPGWKKGTKITFEGKGDERPGNLPPDIIFSIDEERHPLFKRDGDDLELKLQIPLVKALTGCSLTVPLLGGENMNLSFDDILYPGYEKVIPGQGMPINTDEEKRGDLRIKFLVDFPMHLSRKQRSQAHAILRQCT
ncbi:dnaJ subfamily B member 4 [Tripterygium wilfordii]|uniref:DnaJ subfamily B member 4 n=1 Tax=Tripterygium wilfordii TaxID=458696 RepID=A0A7J7CHL1_TRIWF|nr:chaperone protein dnaJ 2 [Tripterygium wilfordii]KAF5733524.1 dnaJ subfamily B member 4 [Tripterygium wilfordii]